MPTYEYHCSACQANFDVVESIRANPLSTCRECGEDGRVNRVLFAPTVIDATPKTLGSVADRNEGPGRSYWLDKRREETNMPNVKPKPPRPYWRDSDVVNTKLATLTPEQKQNYILTGSTSEPLAPSITTTGGGE